jgi:two-component system sensor histidine kinase UhpB
MTASSGAARRDALWLCLLSTGFFFLAAQLELSEHVARLAEGYERWQLDELPLTLLLLALGLVWFGWRRWRELRQAMQVGARLAAQNRELAQRLIGLQEEERRNLARELHDELAQLVGAIKLDAQGIQRQLDGVSPNPLSQSPESQNPVSQSPVSQNPGKDVLHINAHAIVQAADQLHALTRDLLQQLRPAGLDELGLQACVQALAERWELRHGIECVFLPEGDLQGLGEALDITLYRMLQEGLNNIARHANAQRALLRLQRQADSVQISIEDDGIGLPLRRHAAAEATEAVRNAANQSTGFGLIGMRERIAALGGSLQLLPGSRGGLCLRASLPLMAVRRS